MAPAIQIRLLGPFEARRKNGEALPPPGRQSMALLACLALPDAATRARQDLADLLWPGRGPEHANGSLRQELLRLRRAFGDEIAVSDGATRSPRLDGARFDIDVHHLCQAASEPGGSTAAVAFYRGLLLEGFPVREGDAFSCWLSRQRRRLHDAALGSMRRALRSAEGSEPLAERMLELDPGCEEATRFLMRVHAGRGDIGRARHVFRHCGEALRTRLVASPSHETRALMARVDAELATSTVTPFGVAADGPAAPGWARELQGRPAGPATPPARPHAVVSDRPSIAVLPFVELAGSSGPHGFVAEAVTEDVTNALARMPGFFVTSRHSAMAYRGACTDVRRIAAELGVRYLLEGSVEACPGRMRSNVRLVDGSSGFHLWAETVEAAADDGAAMRDRIVLEAVARIQPRLRLAEMRRAPGTPPADRTAWTWMQRANAIITQPRDREVDLQEATVLLRQALAADPGYGMAHATLSAVYTWRSMVEVNLTGLRGRRQARKHMGLALGNDPDNASVLICCAETALYASGDLDHALSMLERAVALNPNDANGLAQLGHVRRLTGGHPRTSLALIEQAMRLSPRDPFSASWLHHGAWCHWRLGEFDAMRAWAQKSTELYPASPFPWIALTCALGLCDRDAEAREAVSAIKECMPAFSPTKFYWLARFLYGHRFRGSVRAGHRTLRDVLSRAAATG